LSAPGEAGAVVVSPQPGQPPGAEPAPNPGQTPANPAAGDAKPAGSEAEKKKEDAAASSDSIQRPDKPPRVPDPREFDAKPDADGRIEFNFYGQAWPDVLQWLANISDYSLDWQELPKDYVNVTNTRAYTLAEALDLFNRLLLERGYTMIPQGRILSVIRISKVDPSLLTRVEDEADLLDLPAHQFAKITFKLPDELKADQAATDVKPLLSPHAKVQPLLATNRLLVIDAVINLREVSQLLNAEHAAAVGHTVPTEFTLRFARANRVADQVMILLGLDPASRRTPEELQVETQRLQLFQQMQQRGADVSKFLRPDSAPKVFLAVNERNNSILVNAPRGEMQIIQRAIEHLDIPSGAAASALSGALSMQKYQLVTISPQAVLTALQEIGDLDPRTQLQTDSDAKIVFANATAADHQKIQAMIDNLDGTGRQLEVIWLRRLPADSVAATLHNLMVGKEEKEDENSRRPYYFYSYSDGNNQKQKPKGEFRVDADIENNRLLLWANDSELKEVRQFLEKLGEIPGRSGNPHTVRFLDPRNEQATRALLEQLQRIWTGPNELRVEPPPPQDEPSTKAAPEASKSRQPANQEAGTAPPTSYLVAARPVGSPPAVAPSRTSLSVVGVAAEKNANAELGADSVAPAAEAAPPITIGLTADGRLYLNSPDTTALDQLEDLIASLTPPAADFQVFYLKYASASLVTLNLEEYFEGEEQFNTEDNWWRAYYGFSFQGGASPEGGGLGKRRKIRFIFDFDTNSILATNATPAQLAIVDSLIKIYDMPPSEDSISARSFQIFQLKYSRADSVAKTIKEVYRDLLSSKDKDFDQRNGQKSEGSQTNNYYRISGGAGGSESEKPTKVKASFQGALSVGVDDVSNTVIVSAQEDWMPSIAKMIEFLDESARPKTAVTLHRLDGQVDAKTLQTVLAQLVGEVWVGDRPPPKPQPQAQPPGQPAASPQGVQTPGGTATVAPVVVP